MSLSALLPLTATVGPRRASHLRRRAEAARQRLQAKAALRTELAVIPGAHLVDSEAPVHTSRRLRDLLEKNPEESFTVDKIVSSMGTGSFGTTLLLFSLPEVLPIPIPGIFAVVVIPTLVISAQMMAGHPQVRLPQFVLRRTVPRKALAGVIHAILPFLERAERHVRPRMKWAAHRHAQRFIGAYIFLLALMIALPIPGTNLPLALSIFIIALGLVENDGLVIGLGLVIGILAMSLAAILVFVFSTLIGSFFGF